MSLAYWGFSRPPFSKELPVEDFFLSAQFAITQEPFPFDHTKFRDRHKTYHDRAPFQDDCRIALVFDKALGH